MSLPSKFTFKIADEPIYGHTASLRKSDGDYFILWESKYTDIFEVSWCTISPEEVEDFIAESEWVIIEELETK